MIRPCAPWVSRACVVPASGVCMDEGSERDGCSRLDYLQRMDRWCKSWCQHSNTGVHQAWRKPLTYFRIYLFINYSALTQRLYYKPLHFPPILRQGKVSWRIPAKSPHTFVPYLCHLIRAAPSHPDNFAYTRTFD